MLRTGNVLRIMLVTGIAFVLGWITSLMQLLTSEQIVAVDRRDMQNRLGAREYQHQLFVDTDSLPVASTIRHEVLVYHWNGETRALELRLRYLPSLAREYPRRRQVGSGTTTEAKWSYLACPYLMQYDVESI